MLVTAKQVNRSPVTKTAGKDVEWTLWGKYALKVFAWRMMHDKAALT